MLVFKLPAFQPTVSWEISQAGQVLVGPTAEANNLVAIGVIAVPTIILSNFNERLKRASTVRVSHGAMIQCWAELRCSI